MERQDADYKWFKENLKELYQHYPDKYLAISNEKVIYAGDKQEEVLEHALSMCKAGDFIIQKATRDNEPMLYVNHAVRFYEL